MTLLDNPADDNAPEMAVRDQCVVALTWTLSDSLGQELDVLDAPVEFLVGGDDLLAAIEGALQGKTAGDRLDLHLEPADAFGEYDEALVYLEARAHFPDVLEEGMTFEGTALNAACNAPRTAGTLYTVTDVYPEHVVLDGNHPLAGIALRLKLKIHAVREATISEVGCGSAGTGFFRIAPAQTMPPENHTLH